MLPTSIRLGDLLRALTPIELAQFKAIILETKRGKLTTTLEVSIILLEPQVYSSLFYFVICLFLIL